MLISKCQTKQQGPFRDQNKHHNGYFMMSLILIARNHEEHQDGNTEMIAGEVDIVVAVTWYTFVVLCGVAVI